MMRNKKNFPRSAHLTAIVLVLTVSILSSCAAPQAPLAPAGSVLPQSPTTSAATQESQVKYSRSFTSSFDTVITLIAYADNQAAFDRWADLAESEFQKLHQLFDIYHEYPGINNLMTINKMAGKGPIPVDTRILDLIEIYLDNDHLAPGKVNPTLGLVLRIWHDHREAAESGQATVPNLTDLQAAAEHIDPATLRIDRQAATLELTDPLVQLDVGAVAKGYATEMVAQLLQDQGLTSGIISAGGSNVRLIGKPADPSRETWAIGIQNPFASMLIPEGQSVDVILANDTSVVTSGDYQRYYLVDGVVYHHLIDPDTLMPANYQRAVTIVTPDSGLADYLSTAVFLLPYEEGRKLVESLPDCEALWIFQDGSMQATAGLVALLKDKAQGNAKEMAEALAK
jgi:thiamine biosynthesis lipoprotein